MPETTEVGIVVGDRREDGFVHGAPGLIEYGYLERPIETFRITARLGRVRIGYGDGAYSESAQAAYSAKTEVHPDHRRRGVGTMLLQKKLEIFRERGAEVVYSMVASKAGIGLVDSCGFRHDEPLSVELADEYWSRTIGGDNRA